MDLLKNLKQLFMKGKLSDQADVEDEYPNLDEALAAARELEDCRQRARALLRLVPHLSPSDRNCVRHEVLAAVHECTRNAHKWAPAEIVVPLEAQTAYAHMLAWSVIVSQMPKDLLDVMVTTVREIEDEHEREWALAALKDVFDPMSVDQAQRRLEKRAREGEI
jgi:hypothetical protein